MRLRSRTLLTAGLACLSTAVLAGGALAHGGHGSKSGERGDAALRVEVRGAITALMAPGTGPGSITVSAADVMPAPLAPVTTATPAPTTDPTAATGLVWTCAIPVGSDVSDFMVNDPVKLKCRSINGVLTAVKLRLRHNHQEGQSLKEHGHGNGGNRVDVRVRGTVDPTSTAALIVVDPNAGAMGSTLPIVKCAIGPRTRIKGDLVAGATVQVRCRSKDGVLTAKKIKVKAAQTAAKAKAKGPLDMTTAPGSVIVSRITCAVPPGSTLLTGFMQNEVVEIKCSGFPLVLDQIEHEDN